VDTTGAGDVFHAGFIYGLLQNWEVTEILRFAIRKEADAAAFYPMAADRSTPGIKKTFKELAKMEEGHKKKA
jgi:sugar/nucleoside kinase (ribokinase family)